ncbi:nitrogen metabolism signal transduction histidine kinase [Candidatus Symbiobacter mobilis CR]|uniref:Sensory histidine kinase/phosphatase NtrB n=2 Tax=Candidatus Symbiobacter TaxID=1436289 RepID=U5N9Y6_9BURK|nr:nitrogen metabolism signal transduction histidine kinase [Candidatus Symbiobacter mobilis CR]
MSQGRNPTARPTLPGVAEGGCTAFDLLSTLIAVVAVDGTVRCANAALEDALGVSRKQILGAHLPDSFSHPDQLRSMLQAAGGFAALRFDALLSRPGRDSLPVHVLLTRTDRETVIVEMLPLEMQARQEREDRLTEQTRANREMFRNLAHEVKNPLGGIRGAAQLLDMELASPELQEYTRVIIHEADRLQSLVDKLLAPHRHPHTVSDVNIHEVCERVRTLILAEFPRGLTVVRDYDTSLPEFRGDREHLIQAVLNIARNACLALEERLASADARIVFRTRVARQTTIGRQRYRLALELRVIDNGPGVPEAIRDRIFYPLVSGREGGSGLGLTLAQTFVQQHFGTIEFESIPGCTDFRILIPLP